MSSKWAQDLIKEIKEIKAENKITYTEIMMRLEKNGVSKLSMSTLRRVFRDGSELRASSFNYEETLLPIHTAIMKIGEKERPPSPLEAEIEGHRAVIYTQGEELGRLIEMKERLEANVDLLTAQLAEKDALIARLIDRLDRKDEIISQFLIDLKQKDEIVNRLSGMNRRNHD